MKAYENVLLRLFSKKLNKLSEYKNFYNNESCYIFGDGSSIKYYDLVNFSDRLGFAGNFFPFHNDFNKLAVKFCSIADPFWFYPFQRVRTAPINNPSQKFTHNIRQREYKRMLLENPQLTLITNLSNIFGLRKAHNPLFTYKKLPNIDFEEFPSRSYEIFASTFRTLISIAIYMGFSDIFLIGFDYTDSSPKASHWYETGKGILIDDMQYEEKFIKYAMNFANITSISTEGKSSYVKSISYKEYTGSDLAWKENTEICSSKRLEILATWPHYKIYS